MPFLIAVAEAEFWYSDLLPTGADDTPYRLDLAAYSSLVAGEYGIPAVVGTKDATRRLRDWQTVTVDGGAGTIELSR